MGMNLRLLIALSVCSSAHGGPMGLEMGESLEQLQQKAELTSEKPFFHRTTKLPGGHPNFDLYVLMVTPEHGLCKIMALSRTIETSVYGSELLDEFNKYFEVLNRKYGEAKRFDFLRAGSIWKDPRYWMTALQKKERRLAAFWTKKEVPLPDNLSGIQLTANALSTTKGTLVLSYEFENMSSCVEQVRQEEDSSL